MLSISSLPIHGQEAALTVLERGPNHRVIELTQAPTADNPQGKVIRYTELATGMHFWDGTEWKDSDPDYDLNGPTAVAQRTAHKVTLKSNLAEVDSVQVVTPDGLEFRARPLFLAYRDGTNVALVAEVKDCVGEWVAPGVVVYNGAFEGINASVRYTTTQFGFEQDVLLFDQQGLNPVSDYGMNTNTATLECWSEITRAPQARQTSIPMANQEQDVLIQFGTMEIRQGLAFTSTGDGPQVPVFKRYGVVDGKTFLVESVRSRDFWQLLETLPATSEPNPDEARVRKPKTHHSDRELLASLTAKGKRTAGRFKQGTWERKKAVVLDYQLVQTNPTNWTFTAGETFLVSGPTTFSGSTRFEGGSVIKFSKNVSASLSLSGAIVWDAAPYRPVILTARDDDSVGQPLSTGTLSGTYATDALNLTGTGQPALMIQHLRVSYAQTAVRAQYWGSSNPLTIRHAQFVSCSAGVKPQFGTYRVQNVLMTGLAAAFSGYYNATIQAAHLSVNNTPLFHETTYNPSVSTFVVDNSLLNGSSTAGLSYSGTGTTYTYPASSTMFTAVGGGGHYLSKTSALRNTGTATIDTQLKADLQLMTTEPPSVLANDLLVDTDLTPSAQRDTDALDAGAHYVPIDWLVPTLNVAGCALNMRGGVVVAFTGSAGIWPKPGSTLSSEGLPHRMNVIARYSTVQESPASGAAGGGVAATAIYTGNTGVTLATAPAVDCRFTAFFPGYGSYHLFTSDGVGGASFYLTKSVNLRDCQFYGGVLSLGANTASATVTLNNNLVYRGGIVCSGLMAFSMNNHLNWRASLSVTAPAASAWVFKDNIFDACSSVTQTGAALTHDYNGYVNGSVRLTPSAANDRVIASFSYSGLSVGLGPWYHTDATYASGLVDRGSQTWAAAGLAHHTVKTGQVPERLDNSSGSSGQVDIGFHFAAVDTTTGLPLDTDGDGIFDVVEDRNGDGASTPGPGETNYLVSESGQGGSAPLLVYTLLK
ncbi:MAG: hypothetical protein HY299_08690 [Verrucomicrobia bacterium]|nr:hypothetical protein [Verrucomicrobiota bacterium]